jgi:hypothetical protein
MKFYLDSLISAASRFYSFRSFSAHRAIFAFVAWHVQFDQSDAWNSDIGTSARTVNDRSGAYDISSVIL